MPMPAVTFVHRTIQSSQNCGVFQACATATLCVLIRALCEALGTHPAGFQSGRGTRIVNVPYIMKMK